MIAPSERLPPELSVVLVVTLIATSVLRSPFGVQDATGQTLIAAVLLSANVSLMSLMGQHPSTPAQFNLGDSKRCMVCRLLI